MQVIQTPRNHPLSVIADGAMVPVAKRDEERDKRIAVGLDITAGNTLANEVMAFTRGSAVSWYGFAKRLIGLTHEGRAQFIKALDADLKAMRVANRAGETKEDKAAANKRVASATVQCSRLRTIAKAFNGAASVSGLIGFVAAQMHVSPDGLKLEDCSYVFIYDYAKTFNGTKARAQQDWLAKLGKWLDNNPVDETDDEMVKARNAIVSEYNRQVVTTA